LAKPIAIIPSTPESESEIENRLELARISHAKAILSAYELLQQLHDAKVIDLLRGALDAGDTLVTKLAVASKAPESIHAVRNIVSLGRILGSVDPDVLHALADELSSQEHTRLTASPPSFWRAMRMIAGKDSRRALVGGAAFLQAFGRALVTARSKK
jgi:uncharacterized protein YjgD (DUF1641 family)